MNLFIESSWNRSRRKCVVNRIVVRSNRMWYCIGVDDALVRKRQYVDCTHNKLFKIISIDVVNNCRVIILNLTIKVTEWIFEGGKRTIITLSISLKDRKHRKIRIEGIFFASTFIPIPKRLSCSDPLRTTYIRCYGGFRGGEWWASNQKKTSVANCSTNRGCRLKLFCVLTIRCELLQPMLVQLYN